ncbi:protein DpdJ [Paenibacillus sp. 37]|uniref:protein DpdJ n=1 Tax=Paenibacillus sp. 37 TaxID=2607911 RepID=UPI00122E990C|nr:protein DpdJ [Paenibacillus sp. 37]
MCEELLSQIERKENQLLEWGFIGGSIDAYDILEPLIEQPPSKVISQLIDELAIDTSTIPVIIENLTERKLMFPVSPDRFRTRYAEAFRLLLLLKQRFSTKDWQTGRNLVSHIKPLLSYRKYPKRDQRMAEVLDYLNTLKIDNRTQQAVRALIREGKVELASFQLRSLRQLLQWTRQPKDQATIIGAGTGSGKTKAFYLPVFSHLTALLEKDPRTWTKVIGIYPRIELLKDQFREAVAEIKALQDYCTTLNIRSLTIGVFYGDTPNTAHEVILSKFRKWKKQDNGYVCPSLSCPTCGSAMVWHEEDVEWEINHGGTGEKERLTCEDHTCGFHVGPGQIILTRKRMIAHPPDVLFTSTEMLNRKLTNIVERRLFGVGSIEPPLFVLMDEVHIYEGVSGAHVAYLLRRWRKQMRRGEETRGTHFVGLSATLSNPKSFFSQLTGLREELVDYITPGEDEMVSEGMEYNLIVRGDPFSATSILSTSVQTAMLMGRILDPLHEDVSRGAIGSKLFGFTDKLDVINRWYHIEVDAEKYKKLSQYRDYDLFQDVYDGTVAAQVALGQIWTIPKMIHSSSLREPLTLDITSSQHKGVKDTAKLVIATSTLEVGYNDTKVGAVIQHKAPRNLASFLQRKGRAGRSRGMRPWTIVVTSAYGRDRYVYDYPEQLFQPTLNDLSLPLRNSYVQRIQLAFTLLEYLTGKLVASGSSVDLRYLFTEEGSQRYARENRIIMNELKRLLNGDDEEWKAYAKDAILVSEAELLRLLWTPPRSFWFELLPTLYLQLSSNYALADDDQKREPLRGFIPKTLFTALDVSELTFHVPNGKEETLALVPGMTEFAPGNVSKRFVNAEWITEAHWITSETGIVELDGEDLKSKRITEVPVMDDTVDHEKNLSVYEPYMIKLQQIPKEVSDRSTGFHDWDTHIKPSTDGDNDKRITWHTESALAPLLKQVISYTSEENNYVIFTRYSARVTSELKYKKSEMGSVTRIFEFSYEQKPAALGFQRYVDALAFEIHDYDLAPLFNHEQWERIVEESIPTFYAHVVRSNSEIASRLNSFEIDWLTQIILSSIVATAVSRQSSLSEAIQEFKEKAEAISKRTLQVIFHSTIVDAGDQDRDSAEDSKVLLNLYSLIQDNELMDSFLKLLEPLNGDLRQDAAFIEWVDKTTTTTLAAAVYRALGEMLPDVNVEDLLVDIQGKWIYLSETESGGLGIISKLAAVMRHSTGKFEEYMIKSLRTCARNKVTTSLKAALPLLEEWPLQEIVAQIRQERRVEQQQDLLEHLLDTLERAGIPPKREFVVSLVTKYLRSHSTTELDRFTKELHDLWHEESRRIGCHISANIFAVACLRLEHIAEQADLLLGLIGSDEEQQQKQRYLFIESLLLSDCHESCPECLELYSPFQKFMKPSRIITEHLLKPIYTTYYAESEWKARVQQALGRGSRVKLVVSFEEREQLQLDMLQLLNSPIEMEFEVFFPYIHSVHNHGMEWYYDLRVREVSHA